MSESKTYLEFYRSRAIIKIMMKKLLWFCVLSAAIAASPLLAVAQQTFCSQKTKQCPDGSYVCESASCSLVGIFHNLSFGTKSSEVLLLQLDLQKWGYFPKAVSPTGYFGSVTKKSVIDFQKAKGLPSTGFVGPLTRNAMSVNSLNATVTTEPPGSFTTSDQSGLSKYPDGPLASIPITPISVKFLVEHRSALNDKIVTARGVVVSASLGACGGMSGPGIMGCAKPLIILADTIQESRNKDYDTDVLVSDYEKGYAVGQTVEVKGTVSSSKVAVVLMKSY